VVAATVVAGACVVVAAAVDRAVVVATTVVAGACVVVAAAVDRAVVVATTVVAGACVVVAAAVDGAVVVDESALSSPPPQLLMLMLPINTHVPTTVRFHADISTTPFVEVNHNEDDADASA
jgi:hypothetical protein